MNKKFKLNRNKSFGIHIAFLRRKIKLSSRKYHKFDDTLLSVKSEPGSRLQRWIYISSKCLLSIKRSERKTKFHIESLTLFSETRGTKTIHWEKIKVGNKQIVVSRRMSAIRTVEDHKWARENPGKDHK